jgi:wyosine [tRNA(Phe)-imidazoG37] synthetase (radical SAM superfamily)
MILHLCRFSCSLNHYPHYQHLLYISSFYHRRCYLVIIAVISNSSFIWIEDVKSEFKKADWVSLKIDTADEQLWRKINQPNKLLHFSSIINGLKEYSYNKNFVTETMILNNINSSEKHAHKLAQFTAELNPNIAYISVPIRPPANDNITKPDEKTILRIFEIFSEYLPKVELLINFEENSFIPINDIEKEILRITSVHPLKEEFLESFLDKGNTDWKIIERMLNNKILKKIIYDGNYYYIRAISHH